MPLSEQEQRLLDEMERHLMGSDADVVHAPTQGRTLSYRHLVYGALLVLLGLGALIAGVVVQFILIGVIGFVVMLAGVVLAVTPARGAARAASKPASRGRKAPNASFMDRMNDRWDRRHGEH